MKLVEENIKYILWSQGEKQGAECVSECIFIALTYDVFGHSLEVS